ncbi:IgGFc-binding protein [Polyangium fumosum]|uniref:IgGFc-binding protein N-terminal domain-containing protein n=1 Tax=Polyangium fumosum TaxID=889272 RepID=A0A4U1IJR4_9BACT|nr:IgGFc-binding protein [Polyangium fumosum]TKC94163.1 hypothetical protein E8A74_48560 [Polyangium fumosum]
MRTLLALFLLPCFVIPFACSASGDHTSTSSGGGTAGAGGGGEGCGQCFGAVFTPCNPDGTPGTPVTCPSGVCAPKVGCVECQPGALTCVGNEVRRCAEDGQTATEVVEVCDATAGFGCSNGACTGACDVAADQPSNVGCEFWAVDLDQQDGLNDPASAPWGVVLSNTGEAVAKVVIELNDAPLGMPATPKLVLAVDVQPGALFTAKLPTRELDCGVKPNDYLSPGTCLSSNAFRITSSTPIVVYQFNVFENAYSNDASLLLPTPGLGKIYRIINWPAGHPIPLDFPGIGKIIDRSYVTVVGTKPNTLVTVKPSWRIKGNPPIAATQPGGEIKVTLNPFDVLNLETDDATFQDDPKTAADLSSTIVTSTLPVAVFSGVETTSAPGGVLEVPTYGGWSSDNTCCLDHLEEQMFPVESIGSRYVITRSPVRSTSGFREPDVIRFLGVAEDATVTTNLPPPFDSFVLQAGEVKTTWAQDNFVVGATKPVMVGQIQVSNGYVDGPAIGDPSLTVFPPIEQFRTEYVIPTPSSWTQNWVVVAAEVGSEIMLDGATTNLCQIEPAGMVEGKTYHSRKCPLQPGVHRLSGDKPFGIIAYGYGSAGSYAFAGGADVKRVYEPPPLK